MVKIRLHGGFFVARLFPLKCCRRFTSFAICLQYPFGAGNRNTLLPRFLVFSGFITVKSQRWVFPFDNMQPLRCNSKRLICFFFLYNKKFLHNISRVRNLCNRWVFFCVNLAKLQCRCGKTFFAMSAVQERKTTKSPFHGVYLRKINTFDGKYGIIIVMIKIIPLFSGSKGNSTLIQTENTLLLLDVGYSYRATLEKFKALGISPKDVDAVVITHEHADHVCALPMWTKNFHTKVYAPQATVNYLMQRCFYSDIAAVEGPFDVKDIRADVFRCSHDARECLGYRFSDGKESVACVTDTGIATLRLVDFLAPCKSIMLESNHDSEMLQHGAYPYLLKRRIASELGHLSNRQASLVLEKLIGSNVRNVVLAHLSQQNNTKQLAMGCAVDMYSKHNVQVGKDVFVYVADQKENGVEI